MRGTGGKHQQQLGGGRHAVIATRQRKFADLLGQRRATGLARGNHALAAGTQRRRHCALQRRLSCALDAFEGDETAATDHGGAAVVAALSGTATASMEGARRRSR
jgi:hypothetical protein